MADGGRPASAALYDTLAPDYETHFDVPHRRAYDELAWERVAVLLPATPATVVDVGCGVGRWADRLVTLGHHVIGVEPAPAMADRARARARRLGPDRFEVVEAPMEQDQPALLGRAGVVLAMGSLQYATDVDRALERFHSWLVPGGAVAVLVDSLGGLVAELVRGGRVDEAVERADTRRAHWAPAPGLAADLQLFDRVDLTARLSRAGFTSLRAHGLLVSASICGVPALVENLERDPDKTMATERALADHAGLADLGKQLLVTGRRGP